MFGTGGLAFGTVTASAAFAINNVGNPPADSLSGSKSDSLAGYALGGGVECALSQNVSLKGEYLFYSLGSVKYSTHPDTFTQGDIPGVDQSVRYKAEGNVLRVGLNYHF